MPLYICRCEVFNWKSVRGQLQSPSSVTRSDRVTQSMSRAEYRDQIVLFSLSVLGNCLSSVSELIILWVSTDYSN